MRFAAESGGADSVVTVAMTAQLAATDTFDRWASVADAVRSATKRLQKLAALAEYLPSLPDESLAIATRFFSGVVFPRHDARTTQVGGSILWTALASLTGLADQALAEAYGRYGDAGDMVGEVLASQAPSDHTLAWVDGRFAAWMGSSSPSIRWTGDAHDLSRLSSDDSAGRHRPLP